MELVEAVCWDITLGAVGTKLGSKIMSATSSSPDMVPDAIDHAGIKVYGSLYEYGDMGILKSEIPEDGKPVSKYPVFQLRVIEPVGSTAVAQEAFEKWIAEQNTTEYEPDDYNVVNRSCIVWARAACDFLGVSHPLNWDKICDWAEKNQKVAHIVGAAGMSSRKPFTQKIQCFPCCGGSKTENE